MISALNAFQGFFRYIGSCDNSYFITAQLLEDHVITVMNLRKISIILTAC